VIFVEDIQWTTQNERKMRLASSWLNQRFFMALPGKNTSEVPG
jgi:hypothetical protein